MRDARVEEVEHVSDSDSEERDAECPHERTIGIFASSVLNNSHEIERDDLAGI